MPCNSQTSPENSPYIDLILQAEAFTRLTLNDDVEAAYENFRAALWDVIQASIDPNPLVPAWKLIAEFAVVPSIQASQGDADALEQVKGYVTESVALLP